MLRLFRLGTAGKQLVLSDPDRHVLVHAEPGYRAAQDIIAIFSPSFQQHCFLLPNCETPAVIGCGHPVHRAAALPMRLHVIASERVTALVYPVNRKYLCFRSRTAHETFGTVWADHDDLGPGREFQLYTATRSGVRPHVLELAEAIEVLLACKSDVERLLNRFDLLAEFYAGAALGSVLPIMTAAELEAFATRLSAEPQRIAALSNVLYADVWSQQGLPALARWLAMRQNPAGSSTVTVPPKSAAATARLEAGWRRLLFSESQHDAEQAQSSSASSTSSCTPPGTTPAGAAIGHEFDPLAMPGWRRGFVSSAHALNGAVRRSVAPRRTICMVAPARNEGIYLLEWIAYHRSIGVEAIFLYSNDNDDGSDLLLSALARSGVITWFDNKAAPGVPVQAKGYGHALSVLPEILDFRWAAFIDLDEFITVEPSLFTSLPDYIAWQELQEVDVIVLNWMFMRSSVQGPLTGLLTERCRLHAGGYDQHVKSVFKPRKFVQTTNHFPLSECRHESVFRNSRGALHRFGKKTYLDEFEAPSHSDNPDGQLACVNHYFFKSAEEYMWKFSRNRGAAAAVSHDIRLGLTRHFLDAFMNQLRYDAVDVETPLVAKLSDIHGELSGLLALPGVEAALSAVHERFAERLRLVKAAYRTAPIILEAGQAGEEFLALAGAS